LLQETTLGVHIVFTDLSGTDCISKH